MQEDLKAVLAGIVALATCLLVWVIFCFAIGLFARLMWIPLSFGWNVI